MTLFFRPWMVVAVASLAAGAQANDETQSCSVATPELHKALDAVHAGRDGSVEQSEAAVKEWLPKTNEALASEKPINKEWFHLAVDLGGQLTRLGRTDEARTLLRRVTTLDPKREWGTKAAAQMKALDDGK
jgi:hypothetical protein